MQNKARMSFDSDSFRLPLSKLPQLSPVRANKDPQGSGGGLGHLALQIGSRGMGYRMIGIDVGEKEKLSIECGAEVKKTPQSLLFMIHPS